jgi:PKD repeat protein
MPTQRLWDWGDGYTSTLQHPTHTYQVPGVYTVTLTVTNAGGSDTLRKPYYITVTAAAITAPVAGFYGSPLSGTAPLTVYLTDTSLYTPTQWLWDFGDSYTSTLQHPTHTYQVPGVYTVTLIVTNAGGSDTLYKPYYITATLGPIAHEPLSNLLLRWEMWLAVKRRPCWREAV